MSSPEFETDIPPEGEPRTIGALPDDSRPGPSDGKRENPVIGWARAIALGIRDTAQDMLDEGRRGAREAQEAGWERFDNKTKYRHGDRRTKR